MRIPRRSWDYEGRVVEAIASADAKIAALKQVIVERDREIGRVRFLLERWEAQVSEYETRALPENARSLEDSVEDSRNAARLRLRARELREALGDPKNPTPDAADDARALGVDPTDLTTLREVLGEVLRRGHFDPFLPFDSLRKLAIKPPERSADEQDEWERDLAAFAEAFSE